MADRLIEAATVVEELENENNLFSLLPEREAHVRPLLQLKEAADRVEVWKQVVQSKERVTARLVEEKVQARLAEKRIYNPPDQPVPEPAPAMKKKPVVIDIPAREPEKDWQTVEEFTAGDRKIRAWASNKQFNKTNENIEWAAFSWNPVTGCNHGCDFCYARDIANRFYEQGFEPVFYPNRLSAPRNTRVPDGPRFEGDIGYRNVFVCSMADLFGRWVPAEWIEAVLEQIRNNPRWNFLLLTKFPIRMADFQYPPNTWIGTTVVQQADVKRAERAFSKIRKTGYEGVAWLSCEPMLERLTFNSLEMFDWLIMGGASQSTQTPEFYPPFEWIVHLYSQAKQFELPVYMKTNLLGDWPARLREYPDEIALGRGALRRAEG